MSVATSGSCGFVALFVGLVSLILPAADHTLATSQTTQYLPECQMVAGGDVPAGLYLVEQGSRSDAQIASGFPNPDEALLLLRGWGFIENDYWNYASSPGYATSSGTNSLEVSAHLFASSSSTAAALVYYARGRATMLGLAPIPFQDVGDLSVAIGGYRDAGYEVTLYFQLGQVLIRISGVAPNGNPTADVAYAALSAMCALLSGQ